MQHNVTRLLRISYWTGAVVDFIAGWMMLVPGLFAFMNRPRSFQPDAEYQYAMGMGVPLMFGWTILLLWADRKPLQRKEVLPITLLVVLGEIVIQVWGISVGFVPFEALLPTFIIQVVLVALICFAYFSARRVQ